MSSWLFRELNQAILLSSVKVVCDRMCWGFSNSIHYNDYRNKLLNMPN